MNGERRESVASRKMRCLARSLLGTSFIQFVRRPSRALLHELTYVPSLGTMVRVTYLRPGEVVFFRNMQKGTCSFYSSYRSYPPKLMFLLFVDQHIQTNTSKKNKKKAKRLCSLFIISSSPSLQFPSSTPKRHHEDFFCPLPTQHCCYQCLCSQGILCATIGLHDGRIF